MRFYLNLFLLFLAVVPVSSRTVTDTLRSRTTRDAVILTYDITEKEGVCTVKFRDNVVKQLSLSTLDKGYNRSDMKALFFDRGGKYDVMFSGISTRPFTIDRDRLSYDASSVGYFFVEEAPTLSFTLTGQSATVSVPVYLSLWKKKGRYEVITQFDDLNIELKSGSAGSPAKNPRGGRESTTITTADGEVVEIDGDVPNAVIAVSLMENIERMMAEGQDTPSLQHAVSKLRDMQYEADVVKDKDLNDRISRLLADYEKWVDSIASAPVDPGAELYKQQEAQARQTLDYVSDRLKNIDDLSDSDMATLKAEADGLRRQSYAVKDSNPELAQQMQNVAEECDKKIATKEKSEKKRSILMYVVAGIVVVLGFLGFNRLKKCINPQPNFEDLTNKIAKQAEEEAKRKTRSQMMSKVNRAKGQIRKKATDATRAAIDKNVKLKNQKGFKI